MMDISDFFSLYLSLVLLNHICLITSTTLTLQQERTQATIWHGESECRAKMKKLDEFRTELNDVKQILLEGLGCDGGNCTKIAILSTGRSALTHPPRFGVYTIHTVLNDYPVYHRPASGQFLFYKEEYDKWVYSHRIERWIIGPTIGDSQGGVVFVSMEKCPWKLDFSYKDRAYFYDKHSYNIWNPDGNGWKEEHNIRIKCFNEAIYPTYHCCDVLNVTSDDRVLQYHPEKIGIYRRIEGTTELGFQSPVYKMDGKQFYLYSHHPSGRLWLLGSTYQSWSLRLNLLNKLGNNISNSYCPNVQSGRRWEYIYSTNKQGDQVWLKDDGFKITCI